MQIVDNGQVDLVGNSSDSVKRFMSTKFPVRVNAKIAGSKELYHL